MQMMSVYYSISEGHFCGTDFWVEVKKWPRNWQKWWPLATTKRN
jgi:hypothetical protein